MLGGYPLGKLTTAELRRWRYGGGKQRVRKTVFLSKESENGIATLARHYGAWNRMFYAEVRLGEVSGLMEEWSLSTVLDALDRGEEEKGVLQIARVNEMLGEQCVCLYRIAAEVEQGREFVVVLVFGQASVQSPRGTTGTAA
jgi:hypothetical protein